MSGLGELHTKSFDRWNAELEAALSALPPMKGIPHELYVLIARNTEGPRKRFVLVARGDTPVAIVGLRRMRHHWEQIGHGVLPGTTVPALPGYDEAAIAATGLDVWIGAVDAPPSTPVRYAYSIPTFVSSTRVEHKSFWQQTGLWSSIRPARRHTKGFTFEVDQADGLDWIIDSWAAKWHSDETLSKSDLKIAASHLQGLGKLHVFRLMDDSRPVSGTIFFADDGRLILQTTYADPEFQRVGAGTRLLDLIFEWAASSQYESIDLGGGHDYKQLWAPQGGLLWSYHISPLRDHVKHRLGNAIRKFVPRRHSEAAARTS